MKLSSIVKLGLVVFTLGVCSSCRREPEPRTGRQIQAEREKLPRLFLTEDGDEVTLPGDTSGRAVVHPSSGKLAYPALICTNEDCPGEGKGDRPYLFIWKDPTAVLLEDGNVVSIIPKSLEDFSKMCQEKGVPTTPTCPACEKTDWIRDYVLPESAERMKVLDEEHKQRIEVLKERRHRRPETE